MKLMKMSFMGLKYKTGWLSLLALLIVSISACSRIPVKNGEEPIARAYDKYLYASDMSGIFDDISDPADSARMARIFIDQWVKRQTLVRYAEYNVTDEHKNFESLIEDYRSSLLIYEYEKQLVREKVDTVVSNRQLEDYYNTNLHSFNLEQPIIKALYIRMDRSNSSIPEIRRLINSNRDQDFQQLLNIGQREADKFDFFNDEWVSFPLIMEKIPGTPENLDEYLQGHLSWESEDINFVHFLLFRDYLVSGEKAPLEYISDQIRGLVLSKRKLDYIEQIEKDVIQDAIRQQQIEIYD